MKVWLVLEYDHECLVPNPHTFKNKIDAEEFAKECDTCKVHEQEIIE